MHFAAFLSLWYQRLSWLSFLGAAIPDKSFCDAMSFICTENNFCSKVSLGELFLTFLWVIKSFGLIFFLHFNFSPDESFINLKSFDVLVWVREIINFRD